MRPLADGLHIYVLYMNTKGPNIRNHLENAQGKFLSIVASAAAPFFLRKVAETLRGVVCDRTELFFPILHCVSPTQFYVRQSLDPIPPRPVMQSSAEFLALITIHSIGGLHEYQLQVIG